MTSREASWTISMKPPFDTEKIIGYDPLYDSIRKCRKGVGWKDSVASYSLNAIERTLTLHRKLHEGTYKSKPPVKFWITSPKPREIASITFGDRVYQRSLNDNAVYPIMSQSFIYDNYACQKNKGTDKARERLKEFLRKYYREHGTVGYVAQFDIKGYYPNMNHAVTEDVFRTKLPSEVFDLVKVILREQYDGDKGYNAGSQLIQIAGISILDGYDHFAKEQLHARYYIRYMDDFLIISDDKEYLEMCMERTKAYMSSLFFELNDKRTRIYPLAEGISFLGFTFRLTDTGKVLMLLNSENVKRQKRKLKRLVDKSKRGELPKERVDESYKAWRNHASKGNTHGLLQRMDNYYKGLWKNG